MAELIRGERRTTVRPVAPTAASGLRVSAAGYEALASNAAGFARDLSRTMQEDHQLFLQTQQAKLETDARVQIDQLSRQHEGQPDVILRTYDAWRRERIKGLGEMLGPAEEQRVALYDERVRAIGAAGVSRQYDVARARQNDDAKAQFEVLAGKVKSQLGSEIAAAAQTGRTDFDPTKLAETHAQVLREYAVGLADRGIITPTALAQVGVNLNKWAYGEWARQTAVTIRREQGADAMNKFLDGLDGTKLSMTPEEMEAATDLARNEADESMVSTKEEREVALINYEAELKKARELSDVAKLAVPSGLDTVQRARAKAARDVAITGFQATAAEETDAAVAAAAETQIVNAVTTGMLSELPPEGAFDILPYKVRSALIEKRRRAEVRILVDNQVKRDKATADAVKARDAATAAAQTQEWVRQIEGTATPDPSNPPPAPEAVIEMMREGSVSETHGKQVLAAYDKAAEGNEWAVTATRIMDGGGGAYTDEERRAINKYADALKLNVGSDADYMKIIAVASRAEMVPSSIKRQFAVIGSRTEDELRQMSDLSVQLGRYGLWEGQAREQGIWLTIRDMIANKVQPVEISKFAQASFRPEDPAVREEKDKAIARLSSDPAVVNEAIGARLQEGLSDATWLARMSRALGGDGTLAVPSITETASGRGVMLSLGAESVAVDPRVETHVRLSASVLNTASPVALTERQLANGAVDRLLPRMGVSGITRPVEGGSKVLTLDPPELAYPEAAGYHSYVLSAMSVQALMSMRKNTLQESLNGLSVTLADGSKLSVDNLRQDVLTAVRMSFLVTGRRLWVEPQGFGADGRPRYAILLQPDGERPPVRLTYHAEDGRVQSLFMFGNEQVGFAKNMMGTKQ